MANQLPPLPEGATFDAPPLPSGATLEPTTQRMPRSVSAGMRRMQTPTYSPAPAQPIPTMEQLGSQFKEAGIGAASAIPGTVGDIESLGRFAGRKAGLPISGKSFFPTSERIASTFGGEPASKEDEQARNVGMLAGGLVGPSSIAKTLRLTGESALVGRPSIRAADIARQAEKEGFTVTAPQVRQAEPKGIPLNAEEQRKMNRLISKETGKEVDSISPEFITKRRQDLGKDYDRLYANNFRINSSVSSAAQNIANFINSIDPAGSAKIRNIAENISERLDPQTLIGNIPGKELRALRTSAGEVAFSSANPDARVQARKLINQIDKAIEDTNPQVSKELKDTNKKYWATMTLQDLRLSGDPSIMAGNVSPQKLGMLLEKDGGSMNHPLKRFGDYGTALKMRSITEGRQAETDLVKSLLSAGGKTARMVTPIAAPITDIARRAAQRKMTPGVVKTPPVMPIPAAAATVGKFVPPSEE